MMTRWPTTIFRRVDRAVLRQRIEVTGFDPAGGGVAERLGHADSGNLAADRHVHVGAELDRGNGSAPSPFARSISTPPPGLVFFDGVLRRERVEAAAASAAASARSRNRQ